MASRCRELFPGNGAAEASGIIESATPTSKGRQRSSGASKPALVVQGLGMRLSGRLGGKPVERVARDGRR
jgi:hypothetical protein